MGVILTPIYNVNNLSIGFFVIVGFIAFVISFSHIHLKSEGILYSEMKTVCPSSFIALQYVKTYTKLNLVLY